ncbi:osialoglycoprotein endopeptidase [Phytophthora cinnamomi]|uniref:osialoglycoprotein endopeptidase n=1 Tax=Phytophthora cinnamomi TaxID=4785 RepID=UPI00355A7946|nr:osialoglycoprotein endopeptidase [Phytophthora cinnamomi]
MALTGEKDVASMARQIAEVTRRDGWKQDKSVVPDMQRLLGRLTTLKVDKDLLARTKIGAAVNKLKKHDDEVVRGYSTSLTKKWMDQVGVSTKSSSSGGGSSQRQRAPSPSPPKRDSGDQKRLESARKRLQEGYASERAKRDSRTVQVLSGPIAKGRRGTTVSTAPSRSSIGRARLAQRRPLAGANHRAASAPPVAHRVLPASRVLPQARRPVTSLANMSAEERHRQRMLKYKALSGQADRDGDRREPERAPSSSSSSTQANGRSRPGSRPSSASSSRGGSAPRDLPPAVDARKAMLDKMYPRVCGVGASSTGSSKTAGGAKKRTSAAAKRKEVNYSEGQREVVSWLKGLSVDMSEYAPAFFENGFDSVKLLSTIEKSDLPSLVPKKGHHRLIQQALDDLRHKHSTSAASQRRDRFQKESRMRRNDPFEDEDSDDSFVVSDDGEYRPGHIAAMFRKNRKRRYSIDSEDSINMEATFDEIQKEEKRSALFGEYEDFREDMRNKKMLKKKKA